MSKGQGKRKTEKGDARGGMFFLIFLFGVPRQTDTGGVNYLTLSGDQRYNAEELARIKRFKGRGQLGLGFVFLAFCLQLAGLIVVGHA